MAAKLNQKPAEPNDYEPGQDAVNTVLTRLDKHGMTALGEHQDHTLAVSRSILATNLQI